MASPSHRWSVGVSSVMLVLLLHGVVSRTPTHGPRPRSLGEGDSNKPAVDEDADVEMEDEETGVWTSRSNHAKMASGHEGSHHGRKSHSHSSQNEEPWKKAVQDVKKANEHYLKIRHHAPCSKPHARVIKVKQVYPDSSKEYLPRCTILHRCSDDVGCCDHNTMHCVPKSTQVIELYFYTLRLSSDGGVVTVHGDNVVEKLPFINHTECECQIINERPRTGSGGHHRSSCLECPAEYNIREHANGLCSCDCFDRQRECMRLKRGKGTLSEVDRRCIESGRCNYPECEYGHYDVYVGRCPRKHERRHSSQHGNHRWRIDERD